MGGGLEGGKQGVLEDYWKKENKNFVNFVKSLSVPGTVCEPCAWE